MIVTKNQHMRLIDENKIHFDKLLEIVKQIGEPLEGNCVYLHNSFEVHPDLSYKQRNLISIAKNKARILEIGFNAGHSALFMLLSNPNVVVHAIDICYHSYTKLCYEYLRSVFHERIVLTSESSVTALEKLSEPPYDIYHIDGSHDMIIANADFILCHKHSKDGSIIIWDDVNFQALEYLWKCYIKQGYVEEFGLLYTPVFPHAFGVINKEL